MDRDGLADGDEVRVYGTDPQVADTDHDGFSDGDEIKRGFEPLGTGKIGPARRAKIDRDAQKYGLHPPTIKTLTP